MCIFRRGIVELSGVKRHISSKYFGLLAEAKIVNAAIINPKIPPMTWAETLDKEFMIDVKFITCPKTTGNNPSRSPLKLT